MSQADLIGALDDVEAELLAREPIFHRPELGVTARRTHDTVRILMPEPFGRRRCLGFAEPDHGWLGIIAGGRRLRTYVCFRERSLHRAMVAANAAGALGRIPRGILGSGYGTTANDEPIRHRIALLRDGTTLAARSVRCAGDYAAASKSRAELPRRPARGLRP
jgi:hypothetical protein